MKSWVLACDSKVPRRFSVSFVPRAADRQRARVGRERNGKAAGVLEAHHGENGRSVSLTSVRLAPGAKSSSQACRSLLSSPFQGGRCVTETAGEGFTRTSAAHQVRMAATEKIPRRKRVLVCLCAAGWLVKGAVVAAQQKVSSPVLSAMRAELAREMNILG